jgi:hypothetical protein
VSGYQFAASLVSSLAWPLVVGILILVLRVQIKEAADAIIKKIEDIVTIKAGPVSVTAELRAIAKETQALTEAKTEPPRSVQAETTAQRLPQETPTERLRRYERLADTDPKAAVLASFSELEGTLRAMHGRRHAESGRNRDLVDIRKDLTRDELLTADMSKWIGALSQIRNDVAHRNSPASIEMANEFVLAVANILGLLTHPSGNEVQDPSP